MNKSEKPNSKLGMSFKELVAEWLTGGSNEEDQIRVMLTELSLTVLESRSIEVNGTEIIAQIPRNARICETLLNLCKKVSSVKLTGCVSVSETTKLLQEIFSHTIFTTVAKKFNLFI